MSDEGTPPPDPQIPKGGEEGGNGKNDAAKFAAQIADSLGNLFQGDNNKFDFSKHQFHFHINDRPNKRQRNGASSFDTDFTPDGIAKEAAKDIPISTDQLDNWFYQLSDYERCFVLTMAALHGRRVSDVVERAKQLYTPFHELQKKQKKRDDQDEQDEQESRFSRAQLEKRLYIVTSRGSGIDRFYWQDTGLNKESEFSIRLLQYIAGEAALDFGGSDGYTFYEKLSEWVNDNDTDIAFRAARALGVFWWKNSTKILENNIESWARSDRGSDWDRAASCLEGAYTIDYISNKETADDVRNSPVLKKLRDWVTKARRRQDISLGTTAAITYSLLGKHSPQLGMRGLDALLELPKTTVEQDYEDVETLLESYNAVVVCYCDLAYYGRIREILQHLATYAKHACYDRVRPSIHEKDDQLRQEAQRGLRLGATFNILYSIAEGTYVDPDNMRPASYQIKGTLPEQPLFDNRKATDLLLEGLLLESEQEWRNNISTLLCAALIEKNSELAFLLLHRWATCVMRDQSTEPENVRKSFVRFMRDLAVQLDTWHYHLQSVRPNVPPVLNTFVRQLEAWKQKSRWPQKHGYVPLGLLAQEVLDELPFGDGRPKPLAQRI